MKKLLIIYPHWPPSNLAGVHRARLIANNINEFGWKPIILTVSEDYYEEPLDHDLTRTVADHVEVCKVPAFRVPRRIRLIGDIGLRGYPWLKREALKLVREREIDFVWIPIPSFYSALLGPWLHKRTGVPYGVDYIDPWIRPLATGQRPLSRAGLSLKLAHRLEPRAVRSASLISGVSASYFEPVIERNGLADTVEQVAMPYGFDPRDHVDFGLPVTPPWQDTSCQRPIVYAGAFLPRSRYVVEAAFQALAALDQAGRWPADIQWFFLGTGQYEGERITEIAERCGVAHLVHEFRERRPFLDILKLLSMAWAVAIVGSTDAHYTASKTFQALLSGQPVVSILHEDSSAVTYLERCRAAEFLARYSPNAHDDLANRVEATLDHLLDHRDDWDPDLSRLDEVSARESARVLAAGLDRVCARQAKHTSGPATVANADNLVQTQHDAESGEPEASSPAPDRRVLIVSPRFPPSNAPDHQRVRMALPLLAQHGWNATVLCVDPRDIEANQDPLLLETIPAETRIERVRAWSFRLTRMLGFGNLALRSWRQLAARGDALLASGDYDLVYFSTTEFGVMPLGPRWKKRFGVPYVLDLQDPWVNDYYRVHRQRPPGGRFKHGVTQHLARRQEPAALQDAAHVTVVSDDYTRRMLKTYPGLRPDSFTCLPFASSGHDIEVLERLNVQQTIFDPSDGLRHWVYVGRCGPDMQFSLKSFLLALAKLPTDERAGIRVHFVGTDYAAAARARYWVLPLAEEAGVADCIRESPLRIGFFEALRCLRDAHALIAPGSQDPTYTASKLYPYIAAERPLLTIFHEDSPVNAIIDETQAGIRVPFRSDSNPEEIAEKVYEAWFRDQQFDRAPETDWEAFAKYTAEAMTGRLAEVFNGVIGVAASTPVPSPAVIDA